MSDFHDPELRQQLGRLSGPYPDENEAFARWQRRVGQARRRRAMMITTGAAMTAIIAVVAVAALQGPKGHSLKSGDRPELSLGTTLHVDTTAKSEPTATEVSDTVTGTAKQVMVGDDTVPRTAPSVETTPVPTDPSTSASQPPASTATTVHKSGGGGNGTSSTQPPQTTATTQPAQEQRKTETSVGGTATVKLDGNKLEIVDIQAADGFDAHKNDHYRSRIDVTFTSHNHTSYITFMVIDGKIVSNSHESNIGNPGDSYGGSGGGDGGD